MRCFVLACGLVLGLGTAADAQWGWAPRTYSWSGTPSWRLRLYYHRYYTDPDGWTYGSWDGGSIFGGLDRGPRITPEDVRVLREMRDRIRQLREDDEQDDIERMANAERLGEILTALQAIRTRLDALEAGGP